MPLPIVVATLTNPPSPAAVLRRLPAGRFRFLLESQGGPADIARFSFLGHRPFLCFRARGRTLRTWGAEETREWQGNALESLEELLSRYAVEPAAGMPPFCGGAVGYLSYDLGRQIERVPDTAMDDMRLPEICVAFYDHCLAFDHLAGRAYAIALPLPGRESQTLEGAREVAELAQAARSSIEYPPPHGEGQKNARAALYGDLGAIFGARPSWLSSNFSRAEYCRIVEQALEHIRAGHIYQANLSQRFMAPIGVGAEALYERLRAANPAPFAAFFDAGDFQVVSASPERFLWLDPVTRRVETRPIKGTRPRGSTPDQDERLKAELLASEKEAAELVMIVDLERNDLGRVCEYGTVHVCELRRVEAYPTVFHTVAVVEGRLRSGARRADLLRAAFPGGSITGAPKIRAMRIIESLEGLRRHVYCGAVGYFGFDGGLDLNIAIRTITVKDGRAYFHAGGGIVADSEPEAEYEETLHKARALSEAVWCGDR